MSLLPSELATIRAELGFNVLTIGAEPYIGVTSVFDQVIAPNITSEGETLVRAKLDEIRLAKAKLIQSFGMGSLKQVDDVSWYPAGDGSQFELIAGNVSYLREELAALLGTESNWSRKRGGSAAVY